MTTDLARAIRRAVYDPHSIVGVSQASETLQAWIERALLTVLRAELEQARQRAHIPTLAQGGTPGMWMVHCAGCSAAAQDYVHPCAEGRWDVPARLADADQLATVTGERDDALQVAADLAARPEHPEFISLRSLTRALRQSADGHDLPELIRFAGGDDARSILLAVARIAEIGSGAFSEDDADWQLLVQMAEERDAHESTSDSASPESVALSHAPAPDKPGPAETPDNTERLRAQAAYEASVLDGILATRGLPKSAGDRLTVMRDRLLALARNETHPGHLDPSSWHRTLQMDADPGIPAEVPSEADCPHGAGCEYHPRGHYRHTIPQ